MFDVCLEDGEGGGFTLLNIQSQDPGSRVCKVLQQPRPS